MRQRASSIVLGMILLSSCDPASPVMKRVDAGPFSLWMHDRLAEVQVHPIDSNVREYRDDTLTLSVDYGHWSAPLDDTHAFYREALSIGGRRARIAAFAPTSEGETHRWAVHFPDPAGDARLTVVLSSKAPIDRDLARGVFSSIRFGGGVPLVWGGVGFLLALLLGARIKGALKTVGIRHRMTVPAPLPVELKSIPGVDAAFLDRGLHALTDLGCRHLLDYELPVGVPTLRYLYSSYGTADGLGVASLVQQFSRSFANDYVTFTTWFASGRRAVTTSSPITAPAINPAHLVTPLPMVRDIPLLARRHAEVVERLQRRGEMPVPVASSGDLARLLAESRAIELRELAKTGFVRIEGDTATTTSRMAWAIFKHGLRPLRPGLDLLTHLWRIVGTAGVVAILLSAGLRFQPDHLPEEVFLAGIVIGASYGIGLWQQALLWTLLVPGLLVWGLTGDAVLAGRAEATALAASMMGFYSSAARNVKRGRRAIPQPRS